ncbi:MAG: GntR family transcriptional regulator [Capsulimonadaceae bacterium]|nr:GntR family transcriptional regulator [Capsulimonadaceae bacterium]
MSTTTEKVKMRSIAPYQQIELDLLRRIISGEWQLGALIPSRRSLADEYNVELSTIQRAIGSLLEQSVLRADGRRGTFVAKTTGIGKEVWSGDNPDAPTVHWLSSGLGEPQSKRKTIALVFGDQVNVVMGKPYSMILLNACRTHALGQDRRFLTFYGSPSSDEEAENDPTFADLVHALRAKEIDGVIFGGYPKGLGQVPWLLASGVPVVSGHLLPKSIHSDKCVCVQYSRQELIRMGVDGLARQSCRRIGLISDLRAGDTQYLAACPDAVHFREALDELGLEYNSDWVWDPCDYMPIGARYTVSRGEAEGFQALSDLWRTLNSEGQHLEGIVVMDDFLTRGCLYAALNLSLKIGKDIKIASSANRGSDALHRFERDLALMEVDPAVLADEMIRMLSLMMEDSPHEPNVFLKSRLKLPLARATL